ncbi:hypothetical protein A6C13_23010 [Salmonella enterica]|nr:hypothetical protein [Salmonella enterica]EKZ9716378.1 hypothetical protein [Klebsiella pneumoniae]
MKSEWFKGRLANHNLAETIFWSATVFLLVGTMISQVIPGLLGLAVFLGAFFLLYFRKSSLPVKPFLYMALLILFINATETYDEKYLAPVAGFTVGLPVKAFSGGLLGLQFAFALSHRSYKHTRRAYVSCVITGLFMLITVKLNWNITVFSLVLPVMFIIATLFLLPEFIRRSRFES